MMTLSILMWHLAMTNQGHRCNNPTAWIRRRHHHNAEFTPNYHWARIRRAHSIPHIITDGSHFLSFRITHVISHHIPSHYCSCSPTGTESSTRQWPYATTNDGTHSIWQFITLPQWNQNNECCSRSYAIILFPVDNIVCVVPTRLARHATLDAPS